MVYQSIRVWIILGVVFSAGSCSTSSMLVPTGGTIAVWDLEESCPLARARPELGEILSAQVIETLKEKGGFIVVERERLVLALEELHLGTTPIVDETTRLELGRLLGAQLMVFGNYQVIGDKMRLDLRLVEVETGRVLKAVAKTASATDFSAWLNAAKGAADELL
jgi:curli biogenesis system outer membrane secretion channel CsgG